MPRIKEYDDELLVRLIAEGKLSFRQIAERVGISKSVVCNIARGLVRRELQPKIRAAWHALPRPDRPPRPWARCKRGPRFRERGRLQPLCRKRKDYDDGLLVSLIARSALTYAEIATRVGISKQMVREVARGRRRLDLQLRIDAAARSHVAQMRRRPAWAARKQVHDIPPGPRRRVKEYDDDLLVRLIAAGELTHTQIGRRVGLSMGTVRKIASGRLRPELQDRIAELMRMCHVTARRLAVKWLKALLSKHIKHGIEGSGETARKCREFAINKFMDDQVEECTSQLDQGGPGLADLPEPLKSQVIKALGGPEDYTLAVGRPADGLPMSA